MAQTSTNKLERIFISENSRYSVAARVKHRVGRDEKGEPYVEISRNGGKGFQIFEESVTYYRFNGPGIQHAFNDS